MASLSKSRRNGKTCFQIWIGSEPDRHSIWLGSVSKTQANEMLRNVHHLEHARNTNSSVSPLVAKWVRGLPDKTHQKLVNIGLAVPRCSDTVQEFLQERLKKHVCSLRTKDIYQRAHDKFVEFVGADVPLRAITPEMAHDFYHVHLVEAGLAESYRGKTAKIIREFMDKAKTFKLIDENPFSGFEIGGEADRSRHVFIPRENIVNMIDRATDIRWRCLMGFAGLCGLRTRSEIAVVRWEDVHWEDGTFVIPKVKTKMRTVPIFADFRKYLDAWHQQTIGDDPLTVVKGPIFPNCPSQTQLTNRLNRSAERAGMQTWPKPWMNLRSSVETYLVRQGFDLTTVTTWLGNSPEIARKHYLQITPEDIAKANGNMASEKFANSLQNTGESASTENRKPAFSSTEEHEKAGQYTREGSAGVKSSRIFPSNSRNRRIGWAHQWARIGHTHSPGRIVAEPIGTT